MVMSIKSVVDKYREYEREVSMDYLENFPENTVEYYIYSRLKRGSFDHSDDIVAVILMGPFYRGISTFYCGSDIDKIRDSVGVYFYRIEELPPHRVFKNMFNESNTYVDSERKKIW